MKDLKEIIIDKLDYISSKISANNLSSEFPSKMIELLDDNLDHLISLDIVSNAKYFKLTIDNYTIVDSDRDLRFYIDNILVLCLLYK